MSAVLPIVCLARHGETAWSLSGQHPGLTDLPLTERGELNAKALGRRLQDIAFVTVFTSPLKRAVRTCEYAHDAKALASIAPPDVTVDRIGELLDCDLSRLLTVAPRLEAVRR